MKLIKKIILYILGIIWTIVFPPFFFATITYIVFPKTNLSYLQILWLIVMVWLGLQFLSITIQNGIKELLNKK